MRVKITKPTHALVEPCEIEVTKAEADRLVMLGVAEAIEKREMPEKAQKTTRKARK